MNYSDFCDELQNSDVSSDRLMQIAKLPKLDHGILQLIHLHKNCSSEIINLYLANGLDLDGETYGPDDQRFQFSFILESGACTSNIIELIWDLMLEDFGPGFDLFDYYFAEILAMSKNPLISESVVSGVIESVIEENFDELSSDSDSLELLLDLVKSLFLNPAVRENEKGKLKLYLKNERN
jgi:hypothetical protein